MDNQPKVKKAPQIYWDMRNEIAELKKDVAFWEKENKDYQIVEERLIAEIAELKKELGYSVVDLTDAQWQDAQNEIAELRKAPTDSGVLELDLLCKKFNDGEIDLCALVCDLWNTALALEKSDD